MTSRSDLKQQVEVSGDSSCRAGLDWLTEILTRCSPSAQAFFKKALDDNVAPEAQWVVFDKDDFLVSGALGKTSLDPNEAKPVTEVSAVDLHDTQLPSTQHQHPTLASQDTLYWVASCAKFGVALIILHILEKGLSKDGSSLKDLDDPHAVTRLLPELDPKSNAWASKIITGFESKPDPTTGKLVPITKPKKSAPTFRQLLTHTAGLGYYWSSAEHAKWWKGDESIGAKPLGELPFVTGKISDFDTPSMFECGEVFEYSPSLDWLALWAVRATGKSLLQLHEQIVFGPLGISGQALVFVDPQRQKDKAAVFAPDGKGGFVQAPFELWSCDGMPQEGYNHFGSAPVWASHKAYSQVYQAALRQDERGLFCANIYQYCVVQTLTISLPSPSTRNHLQIHMEGSPGRSSNRLQPPPTF